MHLKYKSLENSYNLIPQYLDLDMLVTVGEKLDGSNFSVIIHEGEIRYGSRNQFVDNTWNSLEELTEPYHEAMLKFSKGFDTVRFYGEVFSSKILRRIPYGGTKIAFFDIAIGDELQDAVFFEERALLLGLPTVHAVTMKLSTALEFDVETLKSRYADAIAEGIVIKAYETNQINDRVYAIKKKSKAFAELGGGKVKTPRTLTAQQVEFCVFVNKNRMLSYISKEGEPASMQDMGKYIKGILQDALDEYLLTLSEEDRMKAHEDRAIMKTGSKIIAPLLRERIQSNRGIV